MSDDNTVIGWKLDRDQRLQLLERFAPTYPDAVADHVSLKSHLPADAAPPPAVSCRIIGRADDGEGVEALVVEVGGTSRRWDGGTFHITWSLGAGREAKESNDVIAARGWEPAEAAEQTA